MTRAFRSKRESRLSHTIVRQMFLARKGKGAEKRWHELDPEMPKNVGPFTIVWKPFEITNSATE